MGSSGRQRVLRAALDSGWRRADLYWERLQEAANRHRLSGKRARAVCHFLVADIIALLQFDARDPRRAASAANVGFAFRICGLERAARRYYRIAIAEWSCADDMLATIEIKPRARSSLFHLRLEVKHWDTYRANRINRLQLMIGETGECLACLEQGKVVPHRLFERWLGEKPPVYDDARKLLGACLLLASEPRDPPRQSAAGY